MISAPEPPTTRHAASSHRQCLARASDATPAGIFTTPVANSLADRIPPTATLLRLNACWISGSTTTKLCMIQWNTAWPRANPGIINRPADAGAVSPCSGIGSGLFINSDGWGSEPDEE